MLLTQQTVDLCLRRRGEGRGRNHNPDFGSPPAGGGGQFSGPERRVPEPQLSSPAFPNSFGGDFLNYICCFLCELRKIGRYSAAASG
jgi:hypothetical protein